MKHKYLNDEDVLRIYDTLRERMVYSIMNSGEIFVDPSEHAVFSEEATEHLLREEAEKRLNALIRDNISSRFYKEKKLKKLRRLKDYEKFMMDPERQYLSREYYFDPNMGVTLDGHIAEIKAEAPEIEVATR